MGPKTPVAQSSELFLQLFCEMLNAKLPLVKLADVIDWEEIERSFGVPFQGALSGNNGQPCFIPLGVINLLKLFRGF
jgi:IS5 family transposase